MTRLIDIRVPSESFEGTRAQLLRWLKPAGEAVIEGEPLIEVETDKVTVEIAASASGVLREVLKEAQAEIVVGDLLGRIESGSAPAAAAAAPAPRAVALAPAVDRPQASQALS